MAERGIDISGLRARRIKGSDFQRFTLILAMDRWNYDVLKFMCPKPHAHKIKYLLDYAPQLRIKEVPDPFHTDGSVFERVLQIIETAARGLLDHLLKSLESGKSF
jgi:protein-tyrosine phosphatase